ncbi:N-terminal acetyltransferase B complex catalytic subunit naa20, partial [Grifola frondosa]
STTCEGFCSVGILATGIDWCTEIWTCGQRHTALIFIWDISHDGLTFLGKAEGNGTERHGHVTALTVAPEYRRLGLARKFMALLEQISEENYRGFFVDLYVRCVNTAAIAMYEGFGYSVYRRVREYYGSLGLGLNPRDEEDGFDMRKPLSRDPMRRSVRANGREIVVGAQEVS